MYVPHDKQNVSAMLLLFTAAFLFQATAANAQNGLVRPAAGQSTEPHHPHDKTGDEHGRDEKAPGGESHTEGAHADEVKLTADAVQRSGIVVGTIGRRVLTPTFVVPARVAYNADAMAHVGSVLRGRAVEIRVKVGDTVKKGEELLIVESPELGEAQTDFLQRRTSLSIAESAVLPSKQAFERAQSLYDQSQGIALGEVQRREADFRAAQGAVAAAKSGASAAENKLHLFGIDQKAVDQLIETGKVNPRSSVRAAISGQVVRREVTLGELVSPDKEALLVLADMGTLWVLVDVPEARLGEIVVGAAVQVQTAGGALVDGKVALIGSEIDAETRTGKVRVEVANSDSKLRPGMFARAEIAVAAPGGSAEVLSVPEEAVQNVEGAPAVFVPVPGEENTFAKRTVTLGPTVGGHVQVLTGLKEGERVVTAGAFILKADLGKSGAAHEH